MSNPWPSHDGDLVDFAASFAHRSADSTRCFIVNLQHMVIDPKIQTMARVNSRCSGGAGSQVG